LELVFTLKLIIWAHDITQTILLCLRANIVKLLVGSKACLANTLNFFRFYKFSKIIEYEILEFFKENNSQ